MFNAAVTIGGQPVGPKCARRAGLIELGRKKVGAVRLVTQKNTVTCQETLDLFADLD